MAIFSTVVSWRLGTQMSLEGNTMEQLAQTEQGTIEGTSGETTQTSQPTMEELMGHIAYLTQQLTLLQSKAFQATVTATTTPTTTKSSLKVAPPSDFDGTMSQTESFLSQLQLFIHGKRIQDDQDRIILALSYMKGGTAGSWAKVKVKDLETSQQTWSEFVADIRSTFGDPDPASTARNKLSSLRQGTHTADEYVASFKELQVLTGYNDAALVEHFKKGLKAELFNQIFRLPHMPTDLRGWMEWASKLDRQWRQGEQERKLLGLSPLAPKVVKPPPYVPTTSKPFFSQTVANAVPQAQTNVQPKQPDIVPMEIDSGRRNMGPIICRKCKKPGHIARNCRSTYNINNMDFDQLKAFMSQELEKDKQVFEEGPGEGHVPEAQ
jgi:hypothetical protein